jgi:hypothetical protein
MENKLAFRLNYIEECQHQHTQPESKSLGEKQNDAVDECVGTPARLVLSTSGIIFILLPRHPKLSPVATQQTANLKDHGQEEGQIQAFDAPGQVQDPTQDR